MSAFTQSFTATVSFLGYRVNTVKDAITGYPDDVADWTDTTPQPDSSDSDTHLYNPTSQASFIWQTFAMYDGATHPGDVPTRVYMKTFEAEVAPTLGFSTAFAYLFALILTWIIEFSSSLSFHSASSKSQPRQMLAVLSFIGTTSTSVIFGRALAAILSFAGTLNRVIPYLASGVISFIGNQVINRIYNLLMRSALRFRTLLSTGWNNVVAFLSLVIHPEVSDADVAIGRSYSRAKIVTASDTLQSINTTPSLITLPGNNVPCLFIKNTDSTNVVMIDVDNAFSSFPQTISPGEGVYLSPDNAPTIYAKTLAGTAEIQVVAGI